MSTLPPSTMSVPRPAMLVAMVMWPGLPASATISASRACCLALRTSCGSLAWRSRPASSSEFSMLVVPTSTGWPRSWQSRMSLRIAWYFSCVVLKTWSFWSLRTIGLLVGMMTVSRV
ncbi:Uncharacterised protein [Bordetella pertussis]|nr:Uncharacterised protein [Bordetella pertussis]